MQAGLLKDRCDVCAHTRSVYSDVVNGVKKKIIYKYIYKKKKKPTKHEKPGIGGANVMIDFTHDWPLRLITTAEMPPPTAGTDDDDDDDDVYNVYACASHRRMPRTRFIITTSRSPRSGRRSEAETYRSKIRYFLIPRKRRK